MSLQFTEIQSVGSVLSVRKSPCSGRRGRGGKNLHLSKLNNLKEKVQHIWDELFIRDVRVQSRAQRRSTQRVGKSWHICCNWMDCTTALIFMCKNWGTTLNLLPFYKQRLRYIHISSLKFGWPGGPPHTLLTWLGPDVWPLLLLKLVDFIKLTGFLENMRLLSIIQSF